MDVPQIYLFLFLPVFLVVFVVFWLAVTFIVGLMAGWYKLAAQYPDRQERAIQNFNFQSGSMGLGVRMSGALKMSTCPSGLRIGMMKIFGVFWKDVFIPWGELGVERRNGLFGQTVHLRLGFPEVATLIISGRLADRLAQSAPLHWPEIRLAGSDHR